jgi:hypothetical protein
MIESSKEDFDQSLRQFETRAGLPRDFLRGLVQDDDWSFVIKVHACFEASLTHLLRTELDCPELDDIIARLPLHGDPISEIRLVRSMGLVGKDEISFIQ